MNNSAIHYRDVFPAYFRYLKHFVICGLSKQTKACKVNKSTSIYYSLQVKLFALLLKRKRNITCDICCRKKVHSFMKYNSHQLNQITSSQNNQTQAAITRGCTRALLQTPRASLQNNFKKQNRWFFSLFMLSVTSYLTTCFKTKTDNIIQYINRFI